MPDSKLFSSKEISQILAKASEIQAAKDLDNDLVGLTETELLHVADEVGISNDALKEALLTHSVSETNRKFNWMLGTSKIQDVLLVPCEVTEENWERIVQEIRKETGGIGKISRVGRSFEWEQRRKEIGYRHISLTPENGNTRVQFVSSWSGVKTISYFASGFVGIMLSGIILDGTSISELPALLIVIGAGLLTLPLGQIFLQKYFNKQKKLFKNIIESITQKLDPKNTSRITFEEDAYKQEDSGSASASKTHS